MKVSTDALILGSWVSTDRSKRILDIGCGSGILSLMLLQRTAFAARLDAIDIDIGAVQQTKDNIERTAWRDNARVECKNINDWHAQAYDLIVCNPPYFNEPVSKANANMAVQRRLARQQSSLTPLALFQAIQTLSHPNTLSCVMYPFDQRADILAHARKVGLLPNRIQHVRHKEAVKPYLTLFEFSANGNENMGATTDLVIRTEHGDYSKAFRQLCKDFYLRF